MTWTDSHRRSGKCWSETDGPGLVAIMTNGTTHENMLNDGVDRELAAAGDDTEMAEVDAASPAKGVNGAAVVNGQPIVNGTSS